MSDNQYVLLTCVGTTDPVRGYHDGGMVHIMRHYRPYAVYVYISAAMRREEESDNRYEKTFAYIRQNWGGYDPKVVKVYDDIEDVSDMDAVASPLTELMRRIQEEEAIDTGKTVLVNLSSGTSQMGMVLLQLSLDLKYHAKGIQVKNYEKGPGSSERTTDKNYFVDLQLECNEDEEPGAPNRCVEAQLLYQKYQNQVQRIRALLDKRDYSALYTLRANLPATAAQLVKHLMYRSALQAEDARKVAQQLSLGFDLYPADWKKASPRSDFQEVSEFYLLLKNLQVTGRYTEFVLRLNPFVIRVQKRLLRTKLSYFDSLMETRKRRGYVFCPEKLQQYDAQLKQRLDNALGQAADERPLSIHLLNCLIQQLPFSVETKDFFQKCEELNVANRNEAAHDLHEVTDKDIKDVCGYTSKQLLAKLQELLQELYPECLPELFAIYDRCNQFILALL